MIVDPVAKTITRLNSEKKTATVRALPEPRGGNGVGRQPGSPPLAVEPGATAGEQGKGPRGPHGDRERDVAVTDLGIKNIAGVVATGKSTTHTIPVNTIGNSAPIITTHEDWVSPDLKTELSRSDLDPIHGTDTLAVSGLTKTEPAPALFSVPNGYAVETVPGRAFGCGGFRCDGNGALPPLPPGM